MRKALIRRTIKYISIQNYSDIRACNNITVSVLYQTVFYYYYMALDQHIVKFGLVWFMS